MAAPTAINPSVAAERQAVRRHWLLCAPALSVLLFAASGPLLIVLVYSFLTSGEYGGVVWKTSTDGWFSVVFQRDIFDDTISLADAHLTILWRSVRLSFYTTLSTIVLGFPTAYFIATRPAKSRNIWLFLITIPFWTNLLIRTFAIMEVIRNEGMINTLLIFAGIIDTPIQMMNTDFAIMVGMTYVYLPLMVLPLYAAMERLDFSLVEAAYDLYATRLRVLLRVIIPLVRPGIVAGSILVFIPATRELSAAIFLYSIKSRVLSVLLFDKSDEGNFEILAAIGLILVVITIGMVLIGFRILGRDFMLRRTAA